jgi:WD40 repeat protein
VLAEVPVGGEPTAVAYAPDGTLAVAVDGAVQVRDGAGKLRATVPARPGGEIEDVAFSPDGSLLATTTSADDDADDSTAGTVVVWNAADLSRRGELDVGENEPHRIAFAPDGGRLVVLTRPEVDLGINPRPSAVYAWRLPDLTALGRHDVDSRSAEDIAVSPDGARLAIVGQNREIELRRADGAGASTWIAPHTSRIVRVAYSPDGSTLATTTGADNEVWLWDARTGAPRGRLSGHLGHINALTFASSTLLVTGANDQAIGLWQLDPEEAVRRVCALVAPAAGTRPDGVPEECGPPR